MTKCLSVCSTSINNSRNPSQDVSIANIRGMSTISRVPSDIASPPLSLLPITTRAESLPPQDSSTTTGSSRDHTYSIQDIHTIPGGVGQDWESYLNGPSAPHTDSSRATGQSAPSDSGSRNEPAAVEQSPTISSVDPTRFMRPPSGVHTKDEKNDLNEIRVSFRHARCAGPPVLAEKKFWV